MVLDWGSPMGTPSIIAGGAEMARRQRFFASDTVTFALAGGAGQANQQQSDFGAQVSTALGSDLVGVTFGPFYLRWYCTNGDTGIDVGGVAIGMRRSTSLIEAIDQPTVLAHDGRWVIHDVAQVAESGTANELCIPFNGGGWMNQVSNSKSKMMGIDDTLFLVTGQESSLNIQVRVSMTAMVMLP